MANRDTQPGTDTPDLGGGRCDARPALRRAQRWCLANTNRAAWCGALSHTHSNRHADFDTITNGDAKSDADEHTNTDNNDRAISHMDSRAADRYAHSKPNVDVTIGDPTTRVNAGASTTDAQTTTAHEDADASTTDGHTHITAADGYAEAAANRYAEASTNRYADRCAADFHTTAAGGYADTLYSTTASIGRRPE